VRQVTERLSQSPLRQEGGFVGKRCGKHKIAVSMPFITSHLIEHRQINAYQTFVRNHFVMKGWGIKSLSSVIAFQLTTSNIKIALQTRAIPLIHHINKYMAHLGKQTKLPDRKAGFGITATSAPAPTTCKTLVQIQFFRSPHPGLTLLIVVLCRKNHTELHSAALNEKPSSCQWL